MESLEKRRVLSEVFSSLASVTFFCNKLTRASVAVFAGKRDDTGISVPSKCPVKCNLPTQYFPNIL